MNRTRTTFRTMIMAALVTISLAACGGNGSNPPPTGTPNAAQVLPTDTAVALATSTTANVVAATVTIAPVADTPVPPAAATATSEGPKPVPTATPNYPSAAQAAVDAAIAMLASALNIPTTQITVVEVTAQVWTDSGFGCPAGMGMAKLNIPGYKITLAAKGKNYEYRSNQDASSIHLCTAEQSGGAGAGAGAGAGSGASAGAGSGAGAGANPSPTSNAGGSMQDQKTAAAKKDLAARLNLDESSITVKSVTEQQWRDSNIGCGKGVALQVITPGYLIVLTANGADYEYHTDMNTKLVLCVNGEPSK